MTKSKKNKKAIEGKTPAKKKNKRTTAAWLQAKWHLLAIVALAFILYANTITHEYALDDAIVIYDNEFVQKGFSGIADIFSHDSFRGFFKVEGKSNLVAGGRYRPFTMMMFAIEWQLFGDNPSANHFINILLYALLGVFIYKLLVLLFIGHQHQGKKENRLRLFILIGTLIFIAHPIHTEAVANIKGRDEIMTMLGSIIALWCSLKYHIHKKMSWAIYAMISFFIALLSKENAITFLAVVPLVYLLFKRLSLKRSLTHLWPFLISTIAFFAIRMSILDLDLGSASLELMNNPFLKLVDNSWVHFTGAEKFATIIFTLGKYIALLIFPHPLSHDYYPRAIEIMQFSNWQVLLSLVTYIIMVIAAVLLWKKDKFISFGILFFLITLSIVSNIVFPIGTNMSERFIFIPSLGFAIVVARLLTKYIRNRKALLVISSLIIVGLSIKTITRNSVWKNDFTLFTTDVKTHPNSAKLLNAAGGALSTEAAKLEEGPKRTKMLEQALGYLDRALEIHPTYKNAYLLHSNSNYYLKRYEPAISQLEKVLKLYPDFPDANKNLPIIYREAGKHFGQIKNDLNKSELYLNKSYSMEPKDFETCRLLGIVNGIKGDHTAAIKFFKQSLAINPKSASTLANLGFAYRNNGNEQEATECFNKAQEIDPEALSKFRGN